MNDLKQKALLLFELIKWKLSLFIAFSSATGYHLARREASIGMFPMLAGVFLLASGASALNQYQERKEDLLMERTKNRPIPSGRISPSLGLKLSFSLLVLGMFLLHVATHSTPFALGFLAVLLYNGIYTPLKKRTLWAILLGALVGAIPPAIGWFSGGGLLDPLIFILCSFFFIWQIPHSWLLLLDFQKDCQRAGFPSMAYGRLLQIDIIVLVWMLAAVVCSFLIPLFGTRRSFLMLGGLPVLGIFLISSFLKNLLSRQKTRSLRLAFQTVNVYILLVMVLFNLDPLFFPN
jgi:protoheme IX farnesyltransferase